MKSTRRTILKTFRVNTHSKEKYCFKPGKWPMQCKYGKKITRKKQFARPKTALLINLKVPHNNVSFTAQNNPNTFNS